MIIRYVEQLREALNTCPDSIDVIALPKFSEEDLRDVLTTHELGIFNAVKDGDWNRRNFPKVRTIEDEIERLYKDGGTNGVLYNAFEREMRGLSYLIEEYTKRIVSLPEIPKPTIFNRKREIIQQATRKRERIEEGNYALAKRIRETRRCMHAPTSG